MLTEEDVLHCQVILASGFPPTTSQVNVTVEFSMTDPFGSCIIDGSVKGESKKIFK